MCGWLHKLHIFWPGPVFVCCSLPAAATSLLQDVNTQLAVGTVRVEWPETVSRLYTADQRSMDFKRPFLSNTFLNFLPVTGYSGLGSIFCENQPSPSNPSYFANLQLVQSSSSLLEAWLVIGASGGVWCVRAPEPGDDQS